MLLGIVTTVIVAGCGDAPHREVQVYRETAWGPHDVLAGLWVYSASIDMYVQPHMEPVLQEVAPLPTVPVRHQPPTGGARDEWLRGYRDGGGRGDWEWAFLNNVIPCESSWQIEPGNPLYIGPMQWDPGTWATVNANIGPLDRYSWYDHGRATAWWSSRSNPAGRGGWAGTWNGCD